METEAGADLFLRYTAWPADLTDDDSTISGIPARFQDVVALEACFAFALSAEQRRPPELTQRWLDRRGALVSHVARRAGPGAPSRTRLVVTGEGWP